MTISIKDNLAIVSVHEKVTQKEDTSSSVLHMHENFYHYKVELGFRLTTKFVVRW